MELTVEFLTDGYPQNIKDTLYKTPLTQEKIDEISNIHNDGNTLKTYLDNEVKPGDVLITAMMVTGYTSATINTKNKTKEEINKEQEKQIKDLKMKVISLTQHELDKYELNTDIPSGRPQILKSIKLKKINE